METLIDISMVIGPVIGYVHQYYIISKTQSVGTFSIDICGILLFANILRLNFYVFTKYAIALLWQSILMCLVQICLVYICVKWKKTVKQDSSIQTNQKQKINNQNIEKFWRWNSFSTYLFFILMFTFTTFIITFSFKSYTFEPYGVFIGLTALLSESILILPQIIKNYKKKCTQGLSYLLVGLNLFGDIFKLIYFIIKNQAFQFIVCGVIQVCLDSFVIFQIFFYRKNKLVEDQADKMMEQKIEYNMNQVLKTDTEKNFDEIEMMENQNPKQSSTDDTEQQNQQSQRPSQLKQQDNDQYAYTKQWGIKYTVTQEKNEFQQFERKNEKRAVVQDNKQNGETVCAELEQIKQDCYSKRDMIVRKVSSEQRHAINPSQDFFQANFTVPAKSLQNVKVTI